jgi:hypothetical protein
LQAAAAALAEQRVLQEGAFRIVSNSFDCFELFRIVLNSNSRGWRRTPAALEATRALKQALKLEPPPALDDEADEALPEQEVRGHQWEGQRSPSGAR